MIRIILTLVAFVVSACGSENEEKWIVGKWAIHDFRISQKAPDQERFENEVAILKKNSYFIFHKDYSYEINMGSIFEKGKWSYLSESKSLFTTKENSNQKVTLIVDTLSKGVLVISMKQNQEKMQLSLRQTTK